MKTRWPVFVAMNRWKPGHLMLDPNHMMRFTYGDATRFEDKGWPHKEGHEGMDMVLVGLIEDHKDHEGNACGGYVTLAKPLHPSEDEAKRPVWNVLNLEPLTLDPSLQCTTCPSHGHIRNGKWVGS